MKTDWKDDIFTQRKIRLTENSDGTVTPEDATDYTQRGDSFGAKELNTIGEEVNEIKKSVSDGKALVAAAITAKRVATAATATFKEMAENIKKIVLGSGNAQPAGRPPPMTAAWNLWGLCRNGPGSRSPQARSQSLEMLSS